MHFLLYSRVSAQSIRSALGAPEYSYYFLLKEFMPAFEHLGTVEVIADPGEADAIHAQCAQRGEPCVLVAFTAPHHLPPGLRCPVVPVFAWEFDRIPDESWNDEPRNDWRLPLGECGQAITLSDYAVAAARRALGESFALLSLPVPLWERMEPVRALCARPRSPADDAILVDGAVLDVRDYRHSPTTLQTRNPRVTHATGVWTGNAFSLDFRLGSPDVGALMGFYLAEPWGSWSRNAEVWITLPCMLWGRVEVELDARAYGDNAGRTLLAGMNDSYQPMRFDAELGTCRLVFELAVPTHVMCIRGIETERPPGGRDERTLGIGIAGLRVSRAEHPPLQLPLRMLLQHDGAAPALLNGFWGVEAWGTWAASVAPWLLLPRPVCGRVRLRIDALAYGETVGRPLQLYLGAVSRPLVLAGELAEQEFEFELDEPAQVLGITGAALTRVAEPGDPRSLGVGLRAVEIVEAGDAAAAGSPAGPAPAHVRHVARLPGTVFTSVLNPRDDRKNWQQMITAFCAAFADREDVTLALKMTHHSQSSYLFDLHYHVLQRLPPFRCRVVLLHGFLSDEDYAQLICRTDFYVNASRAEGLCIPLMEFMSCGKPAIAPRHTSMLDYLDDDNSLAVAASTEPCSWPHDERLVLRALQYRIDWSSLVGSFLRAQQIVQDDPARYARMGSSARDAMQRYCGMERVRRELETFMRDTVLRAHGGNDA